MELKIKQKMINGKKVMGIISEDLKEIVPFEFENIEEVVGSYNFLGGSCKKTYFICEKEDGTCSLYDSNGYCRISYKDGYKELKLLKYSVGNNTISVSAKKDDQVGILYAGFERECGYSKPKVEVAYKFGKCDEIKELENGTVQLIKHTKGEDRIGYWYNKNIDELVEPKYLSYHYFTINCKKRVGMFRFTDGNGDKVPGSYRPSDRVEYDKLTHNVELIQYTKIKNGRKVTGLKQKVYDSSKNSYHPSFKFDDFLPGDYSNIRYDENKQIFFLEQLKNGQIKKGFIGVTFDWHLSSKGWWFWGYPNFRIEVNVPCEYDDLEIIDYNYALVKKDGKFGLINFSFDKTNGDYRDNRPIVSIGECREVVPCIYDSIIKEGTNFIGKIDDEERVITDCVDEKTKETIVIAHDYKKVNHIFGQIFLCDLSNGKKEILFINKYMASWSNDWSCIISRISPCDHAEVLQNNSSNYLVKVTNDGITDIYCEGEKKLKQVEGNIADITYDRKNNCYVITKNNGHIKYVRSYGTELFDTEKLGFEPNQLSVSYLNAIGKFSVTNNNLTRIYSSSKEVNNNETYKNRVFTRFEEIQTRQHTFISYIEILEDTLITKLSHVDTRDNMKETEILKGNFQVEAIVLDGKRIIISAINPENNQKKYGVIESQEGNVCIDCDYNFIQFDSETQVFICSTDDEEVIFDVDGFIHDNPNITYEKVKESNQNKW